MSYGLDEAAEEAVREAVDQHFDMGDYINEVETAINTCVEENFSMKDYEEEILRLVSLKLADEDFSSEAIWELLEKRFAESKRLQKDIEGLAANMAAQDTKIANLEAIIEKQERVIVLLNMAMQKDLDDSTKPWWQLWG